MSKLADAIRRSQRVESAPMGFGAARPAAKPSMLVGFLGAAGDVAKARDAGADFILVDALASLGAADAKAAARPGRRPAPRRSGRPSPTPPTAKALREAGSTSSSSTRRHAGRRAAGRRPGLRARPARAAGRELFLRSLEPLSLEALLLGDMPSPLTVGAQVELSRVGALARKPLLCDTAAGASADDLQCLRAAGVVGCHGQRRWRREAQGDRRRAAAAHAAAATSAPVVSLPRGQAAAEADDDDDD